MKVVKRKRKYILYIIYSLIYYDYDLFKIFCDMLKLIELNIFMWKFFYNNNS